MAAKVPVAKVMHVGWAYPLLILFLGALVCSREEGRPVAEDQTVKAGVDSSVTSRPAPECDDTYELKLGRLSARVPVGGLQAAEVMVRIESFLLVLAYNGYKVIFSPAETHNDKAHLWREQISGLPAEVASSEAETRRAIYTFRDGRIPGLDVRLSRRTATQLEQLHRFATPWNLVRSETARGQGFIAVINRFPRGAEIQGWSDDEMTKFAIIIGGLHEEDEADLDGIIDWVFNSLRLSEADDSAADVLEESQDSVKELNERVSGAKSD